MNDPIFIAGCGRSGTSYMRTIVDAHPDVFIPSESLFITDYLKFGKLVPKGLREWLFFHEPQLRCWYNGGRFPIDSAKKAIEEAHETEASKSDACIWGQKTPRFIRYMELIERSFPESRWILMYRDPRGVAASMKKSGQHTSSVEKACNRWITDNHRILEMIRSEDIPQNVLLVKFEDLVTDYDNMLKRVFGFLKLKPLDRDEVNQLGKPVFFTRSRFRINTVRGGLDPDPRIIESWKKVLSSEEIGYIQDRCCAEMEILGYTPLKEIGDGIKRSFVSDRLKDISIPLRYLMKWPEYLYFTALRWTLFRFFGIFNRGESADEH